ncbi:MAG: AAA family ATPase [Clostridia bacterium]|nr:AAA family ATPase [Clostridia bacterium]
MLFYKAEGRLKHYSEEDEDSRARRRALTRRIALQSCDFNTQSKKEAFYFVHDVSDGHVRTGCIVPDTYKVQDTMAVFLETLECEPQDVVAEETTFENMRRMLSNACREDYIDDDDEVLARFELQKIAGRYGNGIEFGENFIQNQSKTEIYAQAGRSLYKEALVPELDRIFASVTTNRVHGHPVHYMIQSDDRETRKEVYRSLLQSLYNQGRLDSKRYCYINLSAEETLNFSALLSLYKMCTGCSIIVRCQVEEDAEEGNYASAYRQNVQKICKVATQYRKEVLTIFCFPRVCKHIKSLFYEYLGTMAFVEIQEEFSTMEQSRRFLNALAKEHHIRTDKALFNAVEPDKGYLAPDLRKIFDEWYNQKLRSTVYPQYKALTVAKHELAKATPRGSAYDELHNMIGLQEAKSVMQKALNYYKMQKLYGDKGIKQDMPAMHMVFTGNPGTAKTTVARLFAQIMKDNGLLSKGHLVEVGRSDLVGQFVGWTAKTVQARFKEAAGGVLFIDEAYSLVDDRNGSFGDEAINTIVQEMENRRKDLVVILAGYPDKMEEFMRKNPGLRSRIAFHVPFADYNTAELCEIATLMSKKKGLSFDKEAMRKMETIFDTVVAQDDFGNGRFVRNLLEQAQMNQASRLLEYDFDKITTAEITTLQASDFQMPPQTSEVKKRSIGFAS